MNKANTFSEKTINLLLTLIASNYLISIGWLIITKIIAPNLYEEQFRVMAKIYGSITDFLLVMIISVILIVIPNKKSKLYLTVFLVLQSILFIVYRLTD